MLLSLIDDSVKLAIQNQAGRPHRQTRSCCRRPPSSTSKLAEKVLDSTINIPPLIYQNQGGDRRHLRRPRRRLLVGLRAEGGRTMSRAIASTVAARSGPPTSLVRRRHLGRRVPAPAARPARRARRPRGLRQPARRDAGRDGARLGVRRRARADAGALPVAGHRGRDLLGPADQPGTAAAGGDAADRRAHPVRASRRRSRAARSSITIRKPVGPDPAAGRLRARGPVRAHRGREPHATRAAALRARAASR